MDDRGETIQTETERGERAVESVVETVESAAETVHERATDLADATGE